MSKYSEQDVIHYADGEMDASEAKAFELALREDVSLQADLKLYKSVSASLKASLTPDKDAQLKATLNQFTQQHFKQKQEKPTAKIIAFSKIWYAAAVLVIGLLVWAPWSNNLYNKYADTEMVSFAERGANTETLLVEATNAYNAEQYSKAQVILSHLVKEDPKNDMLRYYLGVSQLKSDGAGDINEARANLSIVAKNQSLLKYDAMFFMALSYLKEKNNADTKLWLNKIPKDANGYDKAQELLKKLD